MQKPRISGVFVLLLCIRHSVAILGCDNTYKEAIS